MLLEGYRSRRVLLTGHTGFKGAWLAEWLLKLGAEVTGYALKPPTVPALFDQLGLSSRLARHVIADVRDLVPLTQVVQETRPDFVFHLAAQPLVRQSYEAPVETFATNVLGTVHLLEAIRSIGHPCNVVVATSDKCYENHEEDRLYHEREPLGGRDPYSSSKACAELVVSAYRRSFFEKNTRNIMLASARAGNVLGGGDWANDRILPDCVRSLRRGQPIAVRNPQAVRPWQHVLEPLSGYLVLGAKLAGSSEKENGDSYAQRSKLASAFNFGPEVMAHRPVSELVETVLKFWPGKWADGSIAGAPHEAQRLQLSIAKAEAELDWKPVWPFEKTIEETISWYREFGDVEGNNPKNTQAIAAFTNDQIARYCEDARRKGLAWAVPALTGEATST